MMLDIVLDLINSLLFIVSGNQATSTVGYAMILTIFFYPVIISLFRIGFIFLIFFSGENRRFSIDRLRSPQLDETVSSKDSALLGYWIRVYEAYGFRYVASYRLAKVTNAFLAPLSKPILEIDACFTYIRKWLSLKKAMEHRDFDIDLGEYFNNQKPSFPVDFRFYVSNFVPL